MIIINIRRLRRSIIELWIFSMDYRRATEQKGYFHDPPVYDGFFPLATIAGVYKIHFQVYVICVSRLQASQVQ